MERMISVLLAVKSFDVSTGRGGEVWSSPDLVWTLGIPVIEGSESERKGQNHDGWFK
jgi:hypothetical protein